MELKIATRSRSLSGEMMHLFSENKKIALADGVEIEFQGVKFNKGIDLPEVAAFVITVAQHIPAALAAEVIKDWIKP
jgi:hypothetical protein